MKTNLALTIFLLLLLLLSSCERVPVLPNDPNPPSPEILKYTVTFDSRGGSAISTQTVTSNSMVSEPTTLPIKTSYGFIGWYTTTDYTTLFNFNTPIINNTTLYVKWGKNPFTVTFDSRGGSTIQPQIIAQGFTARKREPIKNNYIFVEWDTDSTTTSPFNFNTPITRAITLYAKWGSTLTFNSQGGSPVPSRTINDGSTTTEPPNPTYNGRSFNGWYTDLSTTIPFYFTNIIKGNTTLYAKWKIKPTTKAELINLINQAITTNGDNADLNHIDTSLITDMSSLFKDKKKFNGDISSWNTSQVANMQSMFSGAYAFNQPIGNWDTSKVTDMTYMFSDAYAFNQPISNWDISQVTHMPYMFEYTYAFNQPIGNWNTSNVTFMRGVFRNAKAFNQPIDNWDTSKVTDMIEMFGNAHSFNQPIDNWNTSQVTLMRKMFNYATNFNQPISNWNTSNVTDMSEMFKNAQGFNQNLEKWAPGNSVVKNSMFNGSPLANNKPSWCNPNKCD